MRLKDVFHRLWRNGTDYIDANDFKATLTSKQLKVKSKANNVAGLQLADIIAHPSRNEILHEHGFISKIAPFGQKVIEILRNKYNRDKSRIYGKKFI